MTPRQPFLSLSLACFGLAAALAFLLCGCGDDLQRSPETAPPMRLLARRAINSGGMRSLDMVALPDGTTCVIVHAPEAIGVDCDWRQPCAEKGGQP